MTHLALLAFRCRPGLDLIHVFESAVRQSAYLALSQPAEASSVERLHPSSGCPQIRMEVHWHSPAASAIGVDSEVGAWMEEQIKLRPGVRIARLQHAGTYQAIAEDFQHRG